MLQYLNNKKNRIEPVIISWHIMKMDHDKMPIHLSKSLCPLVRILAMNIHYLFFFPLCLLPLCLDPIIWETSITVGVYEHKTA